MHEADPEAETSGPPMRCVSCGAKFAASSRRAIAESPGLPEDPVLGGGEPLRFLPTRFDVAGRAIDPLGAACPRHACPHCRAELPRETPTHAAGKDATA